MADFNGILKEAIDGGECLEAAMRKAASLAPKKVIRYRDLYGKKD